MRLKIALTIEILYTRLRKSGGSYDNLLAYFFSGNGIVILLRKDTSVNKTVNVRCGLNILSFTNRNDCSEVPCPDGQAGIGVNTLNYNISY